MPKDTKSSGNNKAPACESRGFGHKKEGENFDTPSFFSNPEIHIGTAVAATVILLFSGLLAGLIPAWRAMQIKAIDAIREE